MVLLLKFNVVSNPLPFTIGASDCVVLPDDFRLRPVKPSRLTIGHVTSAGHRLTTSLSSGLGFVTLPGLVEVVKCCHSLGAPKLLALARGACSKYSFVKLQVM